MPYSIVYASAALRQLKKLPREVAGRLFVAIQLLELDPRPDGSRKLVAINGFYRIRVGDFRVIDSIDDLARQVSVVECVHRSDAYR